METEQSLYDEIAYLNNQLSAALERNDELEFELKKARLAIDCLQNKSPRYSGNTDELEEKIESLRAENHELAGELGSVNFNFRQNQKLTLAFFALAEISCSALIMNSFSGPWWQFIIFSLASGFASSLFCALISGICMIILPDRSPFEHLPPIILFPLLALLHLAGVYFLPLFISRFQF
jgi:hypothetical protein